MTKFPVFRPNLRRAPGNLADHPVLAGHVHPVADAKRLLDLDRQAGEKVPERVLEREPDHDRADGGGRENPLLQDQRHRHGEQADDDGILDDRRKTVGQPIGPPRIDDQRDCRVDDAEREQERLGGAGLFAQLSRQRQVRDRRADEGIGGEGEGGGDQAAAHVPIHARAPESQRGEEERETGGGHH
jgi:hypothetical protein